jgi:hypothetical protein
MILLRDLTETQRKKLIKECNSMFEVRNKSRGQQLDLMDYRVAFSDGVRAILQMYGPPK